MIAVKLEKKLEYLHMNLDFSLKMLQSMYHSIEVDKINAICFTSFSKLDERWRNFGILIFLPLQLVRIFEIFIDQ
jgi:hypothetical protein